MSSQNPGIWSHQEWVGGRSRFSKDPGVLMETVGLFRMLSQNPGIWSHYLGHHKKRPQQDSGDANLGF